MTVVTATLGWWGVISFFCTPVILFNNVFRYLSCLGMAAPTAHPASPASGPGPSSAYRQLVGQTCTLCATRISCDLDGRFCKACGSPVHDACVWPSNGTGCPTCGTAAPAQTRAG
jgi:hypothetical protein